MGIIGFECLYGYPAFYAQTPREIVKKIVTWIYHLRVPKAPKTSSACKDFLYKLICAPKKRMTYEMIKTHPWVSKVP